MRLYPCELIFSYHREDSLSHVTLGGGVERCQFNCFRVLRPHLKQNLLKGVELATFSVHVILVHLGVRDTMPDIRGEHDLKTVDV